MSSALLPSGLSPHELRCHMDTLKATKPPYDCPISNCDRVYKSFSGIQSHLTKFKHPTTVGTRADANEETGAAAVRVEKTDDVAGTAGQQRAGQQQMSWTQAQKIIEVEVEGKMTRLNIFEPIPVRWAQSGESAKSEEKKPDLISVPKAVFRELKEFEPTKMDAFPTNYIRYIEKTAEELDEEIEYDMDEEDDAWLELINERRLRVGLPRVSEATFEFVMNRLEKDSYFKTTTGTAYGTDGDSVFGSGGRMPHFEHDDDTVCCVCGDGECDNANAILFCDMCNLAVHQECYGVPYIPEGQWLCRRCQLSPSRGVDCRLCPNKGGAFKQTSDNGWAHVICALWVPEVQFANTVFLEPIEGFDRIPPARWKLSCYICKQKSRGACIQCHKPSCYTAFHVTCAQQAGLYMKMETVHDAKSPDGGIAVRKSAFCDVHAPSGAGDAASADEKEKGKKNGNESERKNRQSEPPVFTPKFDMRRARKLLSQKRNFSPAVSVPVMPRRKLELLGHQLRFAGKQEFLDRVLRYWTLKRRSRFGVPLIRRLQVTHHASRLEKERIRNRELQDQYNNWRQLRQDLEKARLLMELVRKRERKKKEDVQTTAEIWETLLSGPSKHLLATIDQLVEIDEKRVFTQPVDDAEVPGYSRIIKSPMDLSTMRTKIERLEYKEFAQLEKDFDLMMGNCMKFNVQNEYYKSYGTKFKKQGLEILRQASQVYSQMKESQLSTLTTLQKENAKAVFAIPLDKSSDTPVLTLEASTTAKKGNSTKQKTSATPKQPKKMPVLSLGDMPTLTAADSSSEKEKAGPQAPTSKTPKSKVAKNKSSTTPNPGSTPSTTKSQKKKVTATKVKKVSTPATQRQPKKKQGKGAGGSGKKEIDDDEDDAKPLTTLLPQGTKASAARDGDKFSVPAEASEAARPSFRIFREDRKSPNSSAVESEMEPASGDEGGYLRKKSLMPSTSTAQMTDDVAIDQLSPEHLDFVWAQAEGKPWMPGVVIDPNVEYGPQSAVRYIPSPDVANRRLENGYLVMLFDEEQSWIWLKRESLHMLGLESDIDQKRLQEPRGATQTAVIRAYERAHEARKLVMGDVVDPDDDGDGDGPPVIDEYRSSDEASNSGAISSSSRRRTSNARKTRNSDNSE